MERVQLVQQLLRQEQRQEQLLLLRPAPATWFNWYRVGPEVGKVSQDHPALVTPLTDEALRPQDVPQGDLFA